MPFEFRINLEDAILEVVYPASPSALDIANYTTSARKAIEQFNGAPWSSLVDQRQLPVIPPTLLRVVMEMNNYAEHKQMRRDARVVADAVSSLQAWRMGKDAHLQVPVRTFQDREEAIAWLRAEAQNDVPLRPATSPRATR